MDNNLAKMRKVAGKPKIRVASLGMYCPGCHYGIISRVICEVIEELGVEGTSVGLAGVGCSFGGAPMTIDVDWTSCPHGRAPAMATAIKRIHPDTSNVYIRFDCADSIKKKVVPYLTSIR